MAGDAVTVGRSEEAPVGREPVLGARGGEPAAMALLLRPSAEQVPRRAHREEDLWPGSS